MEDARRTGGAVVALIGAVGITVSAYFDWLDERAADVLAFTRLFDSDASALEDMVSSYWESVALPLGIAGGLGILGAVLRSRIALWLAFVVGLATAVLFVVFTYLAADEAGLSIGVTDLYLGFWGCVAGLVVLAIGIFTMGGRRTAEAPATEDEADTTSEEQTTF